MTNRSILPPRIPFIDKRTDTIAREWYSWLLQLTRDVDISVDSSIYEETTFDNAMIAESSKAIRDIEITTQIKSLTSRIAEIHKQIGDLALLVDSMPRMPHVHSSDVSYAVTLANEATDTTCFPIFATAATGDIKPKSNANLTFNSNTGFLKSSMFGTAAYTVATLPTGIQGMCTFVTDALAPVFLGIIVGGGAVITPVFYNGTNWVAY